MTNSNFKKKIMSAWRALLRWSEVRLKQLVRPSHVSWHFVRPALGQLLSDHHDGQICGACEWFQETKSQSKQTKWERMLILLLESTRQVCHNNVAIPRMWLSLTENVVNEWRTKNWEPNKMSPSMWLIHQPLEFRLWSSQLCTWADLRFVSVMSVGHCNSGIWQHCTQPEKNMIMLVPAFSSASESEFHVWFKHSHVVCSTS